MSRKTCYILIYFLGDILFLLGIGTIIIFKELSEQINYITLSILSIWLIVFHQIYVFNILKNTVEGFEPIQFMVFSKVQGKFRWKLRELYAFSLIPIIHLFLFKDYNRRVNEMIEKEVSQSS